jgi:preprotein translocase subunit SecA
LGGYVEMRIHLELAVVQDPAEREQRIAEIRKEVDAAREIVREAGVLYVIGSERHESRRIDNQLRGRSGRQGDPGNTKFYVSLEDDLMRIFGSQRMDGMLQKLGLKEGEAIIHPWINKALEKAQQKVEARNFEARKYVLKFDDVMNDQRKVVYEQRREIMNAPDVQDTVVHMRAEVVNDMVARCIPPGTFSDQWDVAALHEECLRLLGLDLPIAEWAKEEGIADAEIRERVEAAADRKLAEKAANYGPELMRMAEKSLLLQILDHAWKEHLLSLDHLRQGINLRAYAQRDPLNEYKREAFELFERMLAGLRQQVTSMLCHLEIRMQQPEPPPAWTPAHGRMQETREDPALADGSRGGWQAAGAAAIADVDPRTPRNAPCPCGSGKKFKHCHGRV